MASAPVPGSNLGNVLAFPSPNKQEQGPRMEMRKPKNFELHEADLGADNNEAIEKWVHEQIRVRKMQYERLHEELVPKWRDIAAGKPKQPNKSFPWENCANLVHQLTGQEVDNLVARVLGLVYATSPLQYFRYFAKTDNPTRASDKSRLLEQFYDAVGYEPEELDLYRIDSMWLGDSCKIGTAWVKLSIENRMEVVRVGTGPSKRVTAEEELLYKGPKVSNIDFEDVLNDPAADTPEKSCIWIHKRSMSKHELQERAFRGFFKSEIVTEILGSPDRFGPDEIKKKEQRKRGIQQSDQSNALAEWDIYECWFRWFLNGKVYRLVYWSHYKTKKILNRVFNFMPDNDLPAERTKLNSSDKGMNGKGFSEMLESYQEELSTVKNQRIDATTMGILGVNRVSPMNKNIDKYFRLYPGAAQPFAKDEFEHIPVGNPAMLQVATENEQLILQQAHDRAGVAPAVAGMGMGKWDKKGMYGSMGTLAVMQDSNTVTNYRQSDFRHSRVKLATKLIKMFGAFGTGRQGTYFGLDEDLLQEAFADFLEKKMRIPIRAAMASANKEVEKQNSILLSQHLMGYHQNAIKMYQAIVNAGIPPDIKAYFIKIMAAEAAMEKRLLRDFGFDQPDEFVPDTPTNEPQAPAQPRNNLAQMAPAQPAAGPSGNPGQQPGMAGVLPGTTTVPQLGPGSLPGSNEPGIPR